MADAINLAMLGGGQMGEAIISGLIAKGAFSPESIIVSEPLEKKRAEIAERFGVRVTHDNAKAAEGADIVFLAVKPQILQTVLSSINGRIKKEAALLSIVAGAGIETLAVGSAHKNVVRIMSNTPAKIGKGISVWACSSGFPEAKLGIVKAILDAMGDEIRVNDEGSLDQVTALSGSGPAFVFLFIEALIDAGVAIGLSRDMASKLATLTVLGSAEYMIKSGEHPAVLRNQVTSPGGTTAAGLYCLERGGLRQTTSDAVWAAYERARELGKNAQAHKPN
jgi:pyrroline-5-carboxylate reductase